MNYSKEDVVGKGSDDIYDMVLENVREAVEDNNNTTYEAELEWAINDLAKLVELLENQYRTLANE